jgi:osmotically-inducible protein OsmY
MRMRDSEVEQQVLRSLKLDSAIEVREICVESQDGVVTLSGTSPSYHQRSAVHDATLRAPGVRGVVNTIEVEVDRFFIAEQSPSANISASPLKVMVSA